jgi:hypothetical protein
MTDILAWGIFAYMLFIIAIVVVGIPCLAYIGLKISFSKITNIWEDL